MPSSRFGVTPFIGKTGELAAVDPETGRPVNMNMMADAREPTLKTQAQSAAHGHLEVAQPLSPAQLDRIRDSSSSSTRRRPTRTEPAP